MYTTDARTEERTTDSIFWLEIPPGGRSEVTAAAETEGGARSRGATASDRDRTVRARVCVIIAAAALNQCHFAAFAATEFSEWSPRASRAPVIAVNACTCHARLRMNEHTAPRGNHSPELMRIFVKAHPL